MPEVGGRPEHARTAAVDHCDAVRAAVVAAASRDAACAGAAVHPHVLDAELGALVHRLVGVLGSRGDHHRFDTAGNRPEIVVGAIAFDLFAFGFTAKTS